MNRLFCSVAALALSICGVEAGLPRIAALQPGETLSVSMRLQGYTISGAEFLFTSEKVVVTPLGKKPGELILTAEEKAKVDAYLSRVQKAKTRLPDEEGFNFAITHSKDQRQIGDWSFQIYDVNDSRVPMLPLYELQARLEKQQKPKPAQATGRTATPAKSKLEDRKNSPAEPAKDSKK